MDIEVKSSIEKYASQALVENPIFVLAEKGQLNAEQVRFYLTSILYLIQHTPPYLARALKVSREHKLDSLAAFFADKLGEEEGHDEWAKEGIEKLPSQDLPVSPPRVATAIRDLVKYLGELIDRDPALYLPYIFLAEYFTVLVGPTFIQNLNEKCGIPPDCMAVVGNHVELDKEHVAHDMSFLRTSVSPRYLPQFEEVIGKAMYFYNRFGTEVANAKSKGNA